jgi:hypothetical protein
MLRSSALDVHRDFCDVAIYEHGKVRSAGRVARSPEQRSALRKACALTTTSRWRRPATR